MVLWLVLCCTVGLLVCLIRWGDPNLDRSFGHAFGWGLTRITNVRVRCSGLEYLEKNQPCIYVANHQSGFDMATFGSIYPHRTVVTGKKELKWIPFFGLFYIASKNILIDRKNRFKAIQSLKSAVANAKANDVSIWIFPEGTRNRAMEGLLPFKKGAFHMAHLAGWPIVPVVSSPLKEIVNPRKMRFGDGEVELKVLPPISITDSSDQGIDALMIKVRASMLEALSQIKTTLD